MIESRKTRKNREGKAKKRRNKQMKKEAEERSKALLERPSNMAESSAEVVVLAAKDEVSGTTALLAEKKNSLESPPSITAITASTTMSLTEGNEDTVWATAPTSPVKWFFRFDDMTTALICRKGECGKMTNCWDASTVICPACGPLSPQRWCSAKHLYEDLPFHWAQDCEQQLTIKVDENTIHPRQVDLKKFVISSEWDSVERYRQGIYHAANDTGDYFIFADIDLIPPGPIHDAPPPAQYMLVRGRGLLWKTITFPDSESNMSPKKRFGRLLEVCLERAVAQPELVRALVKMIKIHLISTNQWTYDVVHYLAFQLAYEMHHFIPINPNHVYWNPKAGFGDFTV